MTDHITKQLDCARAALAIATPGITETVLLEAAIVRGHAVIRLHQDTLNAVIRKQNARIAEYDRQMALLRIESARA
jgi:hypothetical protein